MWRCPVLACRRPLRRDPEAVKTWRCQAGHAFDEAKEGYLNLLITHQRRNHTPGDSSEMIRARRAFLDAGHYSHLATALTALVPPSSCVLDAGCGEGSYTRPWAEAQGATVWGIDIAKVAVRLAARRATAGLAYAVASVYDIPLLDASIDVAVNVFAPVHSPELARVVRTEGLLLTATPGPDHLAALKALLFAEPDSHDPAGPLDGAGEASGFALVHQERVRRDITLSSGAEVADLLGMTPFAWYVDPATRAAVASLDGLQTPTDFILSAYRRLP